MLTIAAFTSGASLLEMGVTFLIDQLKWSRKKAISVLFVIITLLGIFSAISIAGWENIPWIKKAFDFCFSADNVKGSFFDVLDYVTVTFDTFDALNATGRGYAALTAASQTYQAMDFVLLELMDSEISFVTLGAGELVVSLDNRFTSMVSETLMVLRDAAYNVDELVIDGVLGSAGPVGWAIGLYRDLSNLVSGIGELSQISIAMVAAGEAGRASAVCLDETLLRKRDTVCVTTSLTLDQMLLCGIIRTSGEKQVLEFTESRGWLTQLFNRQSYQDLKDATIARMDTVNKTLAYYSLPSIP
jgi:hypothetical protein